MPVRTKFLLSSNRGFSIWILHLWNYPFSHLRSKHRIDGFPVQTPHLLASTTWLFAKAQTNQQCHVQPMNRSDNIFVKFGIYCLCYLLRSVLVKIILLTEIKFWFHFIHNFLRPLTNIFVEHQNTLSHQVNLFRFLSITYCNY